MGALVAATGGRLPPMIVAAACGLTGSGSLRSFFCRHRKQQQHKSRATLSFESNFFLDITITKLFLQCLSCMLILKDRRISLLNINAWQQHHQRISSIWHAHNRNLTFYITSPVKDQQQNKTDRSIRKMKDVDDFWYKPERVPCLGCSQSCCCL